MTRSIVFFVAILAVVVVGAELITPRPDVLQAATAAMPSLEELHAIADVQKLPVQDIEDQSLIYPTKMMEEAQPKP